MMHKVPANHLTSIPSNTVATWSIHRVHIAADVTETPFPPMYIQAKHPSLSGSLAVHIAKGELFLPVPRRTCGRGKRDVLCSALQQEIYL